MNPFVILGLIGGLLAVDDRAGWQSLLAQPVFAALLVGLVLGEVAVALPVGLILELVWLSILPMRGSRRPDQVLGAIVGAGSACLLVKLAGDPRILMLVSVGGVLGLVVGELGGRVSNRLLAVPHRVLGQLDFQHYAGRRALVRRLTGLHAASVAYVFVVEAVLTLVFLFITFNIAEMFTARISGALAEGVVRWSALIPPLGAAAVIHTYWRPQARRVLVLSVVLAVLVLWIQ